MSDDFVFVVQSITCYGASLESTLVAVACNTL